MSTIKKPDPAADSGVEVENGGIEANAMLLGGQKYRNNTVQFKVLNTKPHFTLGLTSFTVQGLNITAGQDPEHRNKVGDVHNFDKDGNITFSVGRSASSEVAAWWKARFFDYNSTFNADPSQLQFAFTGYISGWYKYDAENSPTGFRIDHVGIAQGTVLLFGSNWWFAGQTCAHSGPSTTVRHFEPSPYAQTALTSGVGIWSFTRGASTPNNVIEVYRSTYNHLITD